MKILFLSSPSLGLAVGGLQNQIFHTRNGLVRKGVEVVLNDPWEDCLSGERQIAKKILATCKSKQYYMRKLWWRVWAMMPTWVTSCVWYIKRKLFGRRGCIL